VKRAIFVLASIALSACAKGPAPTVEVVSAEPDKLVASDDTLDDLVITAHYTDGDGDLGLGVANVYDCRADGLVIEVPIPKIANDDAVAKHAAIEGDLLLTVADVGVVAAAESAPSACADLGVGAPKDGAQAFCVTLVDGAGHESGGACTGAILVSP
jgi:hypothetical protein